jgi:hypothetical protein
VKKNIALVPLLFFVSVFARKLYAASFDLVTPGIKVMIVYAPGEPVLDSIAAELLAGDIERVTGYRPRVSDDIGSASGNVILIGSIRSVWMKRLIGMTVSGSGGSSGSSGTGGLEGKWECYRIRVLRHPFPHIANALVIAGSDSRGTAYGVFDISQRIGVSPWYWWADVNPVKRPRLSLDIEDFRSEPPSVKYRGIFINDEDWGLQPWAAHTLEPATGDIGPKTYARVFELLLRLKANLIWPAMHPCTKAFYYYPENVRLADDYQIVIGSSHAEPMLRNNVSEWDKAVRGDFNYVTNPQQVLAYWDQRVQESRNNQAIYSLGMRGIHDSGIEGVSSSSEAVPLLERIIRDQRGLLKKYVDSDIRKVPQAFTAYKEVLDIYDHHLRLPEDVTLVWPDDNYGYIQRLDDSTEERREGGSGVYYHASYWGRPHDYLWLSTTHPALIREEMTKAYEMNARNIWVLNVGDIKPAEYNIQLFMDMAYHIAPFRSSAYSKHHLADWVGNVFGKPLAPAMAAVLWEYYGLAFERKPEFMGWSQTEPVTPVAHTAYNHRYYGDQAERRIDRYSSLEKKVKELAAQTPAAEKDAFYELLYYPVVCASLMNKKFLYRDKALLYAAEGRLSAHYYAGLSREAYRQIVEETKYYNDQLAGGKWSRIMSMQPRDLPVFRPPDIPLPEAGGQADWQARPEGDSSGSGGGWMLPLFSRDDQTSHFVDIFLCRPMTMEYTVTASAPWIRVTAVAGKLTPDRDRSQQRLWVSVDWNKAPAGGLPEGRVTISGPGKNIDIRVKADPRSDRAGKGYKGFIGTGGYISIYADHYQESVAAGKDHWEYVDGLGATGHCLEALPLRGMASLPGGVAASSVWSGRPSVTYDFYTSRSAPAEGKIYTLPTYPLNRNAGMRYAVSIDGRVPEVLDFKTVGRSEEWKQNVLSNTAVRSVKWPLLKAGRHRLKIYMIDPGVILDRILIDLGGLQPFYGVIPETKRGE